MSTSYIIGIDIGGTNTDAVLVDSNNQLVGSVKIATTQNTYSGFHRALQQLLAQTLVKPSEIRAICVGSTHATNAILQRKDLYRVGVIRIAGQRPDCFPCCYQWPHDLRKAMFVGMENIDGGFECHGGSITPFSSTDVNAAIYPLLEKGVESIAIIGVFSPLNPEQELEVKEVIQEFCGNSFPVSMSHEVGGIGFIERENTTILNAALKKTMTLGFQQIEKSKNQLNLTCPLYITQNNGCLTTLQAALENPVLTMSAGPTNSLIGASRLSKLHDAIVVDVGGTSTDVGMIKNGFPKRSLNTTNIGGVSVNFSMPDILSIGLGGGSHINFDSQGKAIIGPLSVGRELETKAMSFGGTNLTLTDVALKAGHLVIEGTNPSLIKLNQAQMKAIIKTVIQNIERETTLMGGARKDLPILLVGGGAALLRKNMLSERYCVPNFSHVANAYGAALAEIVGTVDQVVSLQQREVTLSQLQDQAVKKAVNQGADPKTVQVVDIQIMPYHYVPNQMARVSITAAGKFLW